MAGILAYMSCTPAMTRDTAGQIPTGLVAGARMKVLFSGLGAQTFAIREVRGTWVRVIQLENGFGREPGEEWVNLNAVEYMTILPPVTPSTR
jgi:hypothetical protein